jgi:hypothetical protein
LGSEWGGFLVYDGDGCLEGRIFPLIIRDVSQATYPCCAFAPGPLTHPYVCTYARTLCRSQLPRLESCYSVALLITFPIRYQKPCIQFHSRGRFIENSHSIPRMGVSFSLDVYTLAATTKRFTRHGPPSSVNPRVKVRCFMHTRRVVAGPEISGARSVIEQKVLEYLRKEMGTVDWTR